MPVLCRYCAALAEAEIIAAVILVFHALPTEFLQGEAEVGEVGNVAGFQVVAQLGLDVGGAPEIVGLVNQRWLEERGEHLLGGGLLLVVAVVALYLPLVVAGEPVNAVGILQFGDGPRPLMRWH